jgi:kynureninase
VRERNGNGSDGVLFFEDDYGQRRHTNLAGVLLVDLSSGQAQDHLMDSVLAAQPLGGMQALRRKSLALTDLFIELVEARCAGHGLALVTPREHAQRGSQLAFTREHSPHAALPLQGAVTPSGRTGGGNSGAYAIVQALVARGVIGDFRAGDGGANADVLRFGFTPLYTRFEDVWCAVEHLRQVLESGEWQRPEFHQKNAVT